MGLLLYPNVSLAIEREKFAKIGPVGSIAITRPAQPGGGYTTVEDLLTFDRALHSNGLASKAMLEKLWRAHPEQNSPRYGYGFGIFETPVGHAVGHSEGFPGINADFLMYVDAGYTLAVLSNYGSGAPPVSQKIQNLVGRKQT